jgi:hypothetical protein
MPQSLLHNWGLMESLTGDPSNNFFSVIVIRRGIGTDNHYSVFPTLSSFGIV